MPDRCRFRAPAAAQNIPDSEQRRIFSHGGLAPQQATATCFRSRNPSTLENGSKALPARQIEARAQGAFQWPLLQLDHMRECDCQAKGQPKDEDPMRRTVIRTG